MPSPKHEVTEARSFVLELQCLHGWSVYLKKGGVPEAPLPSLFVCSDINLLHSNLLAIDEVDTLLQSFG